MNDLRISALLCTRLCHDLIGPAGAVMNGVELLSEGTGPVDDEVLELIRHSAGETTRRLKFFRMALGVAAEGLSLGAARTVADDYFESGKITLDWSESFLGSTAPRRDNLIPILLTLILSAAEALPRGGRVAIDGTPGEGAFLLHVRATGETIKADEDALMSLAGDKDSAAVEARGLAPFMTARLVAVAGGRIEVTSTGDAMEFSLSLPASLPI